MATDTLQTESAPATAQAQSAWAEALANYEAEEANYARSSAEYHEANAKSEAECPSREEEFRAYGLTYEDSRERALQIVDRFIENRDHPNKRGDLPDDVIDRAVAESGAIVADYFAYRVARSASFRAFQPHERKHDAAVERRWHATNKLLATPAPDAAALLFKLDLLTSIMEQHDDQDAESIALIRNDARRLLGETAE